MNLEKLRMLPEHMREGMRAYIMDGRHPGTFLELVIVHDFYRAAAHADEINQRALFDYIYFLYNYVPVMAHGSYENYEAWIKAGGINGLNKPKETPSGQLAHDRDTSNRISTIPRRSNEGTEGITRDSMGNPVAYIEPSDQHDS